MNDIELLAKIYQQGRHGDPRLAAAELDGVSGRLTAALGSNHAVAIEARYYQMLTAQDTGKLDDATAFGRELVDRIDVIYGRQSGPAARIRAATSFTHWRAGRSGEAIATVKEALAAMEAANIANGVFYNRMLAALAQYLSYSGQFLEGISTAERVEQLTRKENGVASAPHLNSLVALSRTLLLGGQDRQARKVLLDVLPQAQERVGASDPTYVLLVQTLGNAAAGLRLYDEARVAYEFVLQQNEARFGPDNEDTVSALVNLAQNRIVAGEVQQGEAMLIDAYGRLPADGTRYEARASIPINLAGVLLQQEKLDAAQSWIQEAVKINRSYYGDKHSQTAEALALQGQWLRRTGRLIEAAEALTDVEQIQKNFGGTAEVDRLSTLSELSLVALAQGDVERAAHLLEEFVAIAEAQRTGARADAGSRRQFLAGRAVDYKRLAALRIRLDQPDRAFAISELSKGRTLLDQLADSSLFASTNETRALTDQLRTLASEIVSFEERATNAATSSQAGAETATALGERRSRYASLRAQLDKLQPQLAEQQRAQPVSVDKAKSLLRSDEVAISYLLTNDTLSTFVLTTKDARAFTKPLATADLQAIDAYSRLVGALPDSAHHAWMTTDGRVVVGPLLPSPDARRMSVEELATHVSDLLLSPVRTQLRSLRRVLIIPDGVLAAVPFDTLTFEGNILAAKHEIHYAQSMSVYAQLVARSDRRVRFESPLLAVGAPTHVASTGSAIAAGTSAPATRYRSNNVAWTPLPFALEEIDKVTKIFPGSAKLTGDRASEEVLLQMNHEGRLQRYRFLHFATHAFFSADRPDLSAIVLKQPGSAAADGFLTVNELSGYRLRSELAVLSACETAAGKVVDGDGVMGFAFALLIAGNANTLAALWRVPDDATEKLMTRFFLGVKRGLSHSAALAAAKREVRATPRFAPPINWAGFVLYGT